MEDISTLIAQFATFSSDEETTKYTRYSKSIAKLIEKGDLTLLQFVQKLGGQITSSNDDERVRSVHCLTEVIHEIDNSKLSKQDINVFIEFYLNKFDDRLCFKYVVQGVDYLVQFNQFNGNLNNNLNSILNTINEKYEIANHLAKSRYEVFHLLDTLLVVSKDTIVARKEYHDLYVKTFIHVSSGEKDPRNLLMSFKLNQKVSQNFTFDINNALEKHFLDELFDNLFCYFPISFKPPANDPYKITADQLKTELRNSLTCQELYAQDLFTNLFEKLTSTNPVVRNDVLLTILQAVTTYKSDTLIEYWEKLWDGLRYEILHFENPGLFSPSGDYFVPGNLVDFDDNMDIKSVYLVLEILTKLAEKLQDQRVFLEFITKDVQENLAVNNKYFKQGIVLLSAVSTSSEITFNHIHKYIFKSDNLGKFLSVAGEEDTEEMEQDMTMTIGKQRDLIDAFGYILISYQVICRSTKEESSFFANNYLTRIKDNLTIFLGQLLQVSSNIEKTLKCKIIQQYVKLIELKKLLDHEEKYVIVTILSDMFFELAKTEKFKDIILEEIINGLIKLVSKQNEEINKLVIDIFLPKLIEELDNNIDNPQTFDQFLSVLERLITNYQFLEVLFIRLINKLNINQKDVSYKITELVIKLVLKIQNEKEFLMNSWFKSFVPSLMKFVNQLDATSHQDMHLFEVLSELIGLIIKYTDVSKHQEILQQFETCLYKGTPTGFGKGIALLNEPDLTIIVFNKVLSNIDKGTVSSIGDEDIDKLIELIYNVDDEALKVNYLQHLSLFINKFYNNNEALEAKLESLFSSDVKKYEISIWIIKSLVIKLNPIGIKYLNKNLDILDETPTDLVLRSFDIILKDLKIYSTSKPKEKGSKIISKVQNLNIRLLYKQQIFNIILEKVLDHQDSIIYLSLLSILLKNIDSNILKFKINDIIPLILKSIEVNGLLETSLETLSVIIDTNNLCNNLSYLVKRLLELSSTKIVQNGKVINTERIRYLSLECLLKLLESNDRETVVLYKPEVLGGLVRCLDDGKRSIRKLSCDVRQYLYEMRD